MGLRKEFLIHKGSTVESFKLVKADVSGINSGIENIRNSVASLESMSFALEGEIPAIRQSVERCVLGISMQQENNIGVGSKIESIMNSVQGVASAVSSFSKRMENSLAHSRELSRKIAAQDRLIKKLAPSSKKQFLMIRQLSFSLNKSRKESKKLRSLLNRKLKTANRANSELEKKIKSQRRRIQQLNRKIDGKKTIKKITKKTITPKKIVTETITPTKKTITEVKK